MSQIIIGDILPYTQASATAAQTVFGTNWTANTESDVVVYQTPAGDEPNDATQILQYPSEYSVAFIGGQQEVQVTLVTGAGLGDIITITRMTPADRENLYTNTNFTPSMLNNDFGILTLVDQQAQLVNAGIAPRYNYSAQITSIVDTILPILPAYSFWGMNQAGTAIEAFDISAIVSGGTVTEVDTGTGLTGGPITTTGTISFAAIAANSLWANITGGSAVPTVIPTSTFLITANNLSDVPNKPLARSNLGLAIGTDVEAWSAALDSIAGLATGANNLIYTTASNTYSVIAAAPSSVLVTSAGNVPSLSQTLPTAVQSNITQLGVQSAALNMNSHLINNVTNPVSAQDAATKAYVDSAGGAFLPLAGGTMAGPINMGAFNITNMADPSGAQDAATKAYADTKLALSGGTMTGILNMNSHKITNVTDPTNPQDAATLAYVTSQTTGMFLPLSGGTMTGLINMGNHKITNMTDPSSGQDAVTLSYLNTALGDYLPLSGGTMAGQINMASSKIVGLGTPTNGTDAATKAYVDSVATGFSVQPACYAASTVALTVTYANGASGIGATLTNAGAMATFALDGTNPAVNDRVLIWNQASSLQNGIYVVTNVGSGASNWILTRATDYDQPSEITPGDLVIINNGTTYAGTSFIETATVTAVGTDAISFSQFTFSATAVLLKANNLSDVANTTTSFNNISPLTTKGDLIGYSSQNVRLAVGGTDGQILQVSSGAATGLAWSTATYPVTTTVNEILYSSATNVVSGITSIAGGVLVTNNSSVPSLLANPGVAGKVLQSANAAIPTWSTPTYPSASGTSGKFLISDGTNNVYSTSTIPTSAGATAGKVLASDGTNYVLTSATFPTSVGATGTILRSDGTNWVATTTTYPNTNAVNTLVYASSANVLGALATANNGLLVTSSGGVPSILAGPGTTGNMLLSNAAAAPSFSTSTIPTSAGSTANKVLLSDGTNYVLSTPTFPNASATTGKVIISDGTNWIASTPTFANTYAVSTLLYASASNVVTGLATANSAVLVTNSTGVPAWSGTMTNGQIIIGSTSATPTAATLTAGANISITNGAGSITITGTGAASGSWVVETTTSRTLTAFQYVIPNNAGLVTLTIPATTVVGDEFAIAGLGAGLWKLQANTGQVVNFGNSPTTSAGSITATNRYNALRIVCVVANTTFVVLSSQGSLTVA